jgi:hypothetical protein
VVPFLNLALLRRGLAAGKRNIVVPVKLITKENAASILK